MRALGDPALGPAAARTTAVGGRGAERVQNVYDAPPAVAAVAAVAATPHGWDEGQATGGLSEGEGGPDW